MFGFARLDEKDKMIATKCQKHPKYLAVHKPRVKCRTCDQIYSIKNPDFDHNNSIAKRFMTLRDKVNAEFIKLLHQHTDKNRNIDMRFYPKIKKLEDQRDQYNKLALKWLLRGRAIWCGWV